MKYWLLKTEPSTYSWDDLKKEKYKTTSWEGVRNYQARNFIRDEMSIGDRAFLYHSVQNPPSITGILEIVRSPYPDHFAFDNTHKYYDPKSDPKKPRWFMVDVKAIGDLSSPISLDELKSINELSGMILLNNTRLSVQPVTEAEWKRIITLRKVITLD